MYRSRGITLVELLVVLAIMAIISAVAIPLYATFTQRTYYTEAQTDLLACAQGMERHASVNFSYGNASGGGTANGGPIDVNICDPLSVRALRYTAFVVAGDDVSFSITATPTGVMAPPVSQMISIDETGARGFDTNSNGAIDAGEDAGWPDF